MITDPLLGQTIGNYQIYSRLGKGGMATVYRARQVNMQRDVAIKIMSADLAQDPQFVARFEQEARVIANLQHPRILPVHDFGHEGEIFYLVMRLIEGESLYHRLLQGALPLLKVVEISRPDRGGAGLCARAGHHPPRSETQQRPDRRVG